MYKVIVIYEEPKDKERFEAHYRSIHVPLIEKLPHLLDFTVQRAVSRKNTEIPVYQVVEMRYADEEKFNESFVSKEYRELQADAQKMLPYLNRLPAIWYVEESR